MEQALIAQEADLAQFTEKRASHRRRVLKSATLKFNSGYGTFGCRVRNLTSNGALIEMGDTAGLPKLFGFEVDGERVVEASVVWRKAQKIGLAFESDATFRCLQQET